MTSGGSGERPLAAIEPGMRVTDSHNEVVGTVTAVQMGDPGAVTSQGPEQQTGLNEGIIDTLIGAEPDVPPQRAEQLLRNGYVKIDATGFLARDLFAGADEVEGVDGNLLRLSVPRNRLVPEN